MNANLRAITFDVGGTLIEPWPSVGHVYAEVAARHGAGDLDPVQLTRRFAAAWKRLKDFEHTREHWAALVDTTFAGLVDLPPSRTFFPELYHRFTQPEAWHVFEDVRPAFERLRARGFRLGVLSNWDDRLRPLLRALRLEPWFEVIVVSCEVGAAKPSIRVFERSAQALGLPPATILHVGDSFEMDFQGAEAAGFQAKWVVRGSGNGPVRAGAIRSLLELC